MNVSAASVETNPYSPPQSRVADLDQPLEGFFYVVAPSKFLILMVGTLGAYGIYWFYKNWSLLNRKHKSYWPVMRGFFSVFFTHALFTEVNETLKRQGKLILVDWSPWALATGYVVSAICSSICARMSAYGIGSPMTDALSLVMLVPMTFTLYRAQFAINLAEDDPQGSRNRSLTLANVAWLVLGGLLWLVIALGWYLILSGRVPHQSR